MVFFGILSYLGLIGLEGASSSIVFISLRCVSIYLLICVHICEERNMMLNTAVSVSRRRIAKTIGSRAVRAQSTKVDATSEGPLGEDGRHELWREGIYDHDNEPK